MAAGVYPSTKKDGTAYYRVSLTFQNKHISLGSFSNEADAALVYQEARELLTDFKHFIDLDTASTSFSRCKSLLSFDKFITLLNFRDNHIYIKTPIYLCNKYFLYFLKPNTVLYFNVDDLFYYSNHRILTKGNHLYVNDYGMQVSILSRYGIKPYAIAGKDYIFRNQNYHDFRYENIQVINRYYGVSRIERRGKILYQSKIHINGDYVIGNYSTETAAAIAYNKAVDLLSAISTTAYNQNYIEDISPIEYAASYNRIRISKKLLHYIDLHS